MLNDVLCLFPGAFCYISQYFSQFSLDLMVAWYTTFVCRQFLLREHSCFILQLQGLFFFFLLLLLFLVYSKFSCYTFFYLSYVSGTIATKFYCTIILLNVLRSLFYVASVC